MKIIRFEFKKLWQTKTFFFFLLLSLLVICGLYVKNYLQQDMIIANKVQQFSEYRGDVYNQIETYRHELEEAPNEETEKKLATALALYEEIQTLVLAVQDNKNVEALQSEIRVYEIAISFLEIEGDFAKSKTDMLKEIAYNKELLKLGFEKEDVNRSIHPAVFMKQIVTLFFNPIGFAILLIIFMFFITREFEDKNMRLIHTLPISRIRFILYKFLSLLLFALIWLFTVFFSAFLLPYFFTEATDKPFSYPFFASEGEFIVASMYLEKTIIFTVLYSMFASAFIVFIGFTLRNTVLTLISILFFYIGHVIMSSYGIITAINPFTYSNIDVVSMQVDPSSLFGSIILVACTIILLTLAVIVNKRRAI